MTGIRWGAVLVGALAGLGITAVAALGLFFVGIRPTDDRSSAAFIFIQFLGQVTAGYIGGRFAEGAEPLHGARAGLLLYLITTLLTLTTGGNPAVLTLVFSSVVALVLGAAGGVLSVVAQGDAE